MNLVETEGTEGHKASSAVACIYGLKEKMEMYMASGDILDGQKQKMNRKEAYETYRAMYERCINGEHTTDVCAEFGVGVSTFQSYCGRKKWKLGRTGRTKGNPKGRAPSMPPETLTEAARMRENGLKWREIGERLGYERHALRSAVMRKQSKSVA